MFYCPNILHHDANPCIFAGWNWYSALGLPRTTFLKDGDVIWVLRGVKGVFLLNFYLEDCFMLAFDEVLIAFMLSLLSLFFGKARIE